MGFLYFKEKDDQNLLGFEFVILSFQNFSNNYATMSCFA